MYTTLSFCFVASCASPFFSFFFNALSTFFFSCVSFSRLLPLSLLTYIYILCIFVYSVLFSVYLPDPVFTSTPSFFPLLLKSLFFF